MKAFLLKSGSLPISLAFVLFAGSVQAATITFTAEADFTSQGYIQGNPYTFTFVTNTAFTTTPTSFANSTAMHWQEDDASDDPLYISISSNAMVGSFVRPVTPPIDPYAYLHFEQSVSGDSMFLNIESEDWNSLGFVTLGGVEIFGISVSMDTTDIHLPYLGTYAQTESILAAINGVHTPGPGSSLTLAGVDESGYGFTVTSFSITNDPPPVDVPFGVDSSLGLGLLGVVSVWKLSRRRRA